MLVFRKNIVSTLQTETWEYIDKQKSYSSWGWPT